MPIPLRPSIKTAGTLGTSGRIDSPPLLLESVEIHITQPIRELLWTRCLSESEELDDQTAISVESSAILPFESCGHTLEQIQR